MDQSDLLSTELNEIQNHNDFILLWISSDDIPNELKNCGAYLKKFDSNERCISYINQFKSERKILLILTDFESLSTFENLIQIQSIYVLKKEPQIDQFNKQNHPKLVHIFENITKLNDRLRKDILLIDRSDLPMSISSINEITIEQSLMDLHGNSSMFFWNQLFIYYMIKTPNIDMDKLKKDMLEQCQFEYKNNPPELKKINDFDKNCSSDNVLEWYTKDSFLYRLLNKAFRTQNMELICKFQYFIILLHNKFQDLSKEQHNNPPIVYRGQMLDENTIENLKSNVGRLISMNTMMSTSLDEQVACSFIFGASHAVIFKINLQNQIYNSFKPFIDISKFSSNRDEEEILFFIGTVFQIDSIEQKDDDPTWIIELTLHNETSKHIENLISALHEDINDLKDMHHLFMKTDDSNMIDRYYNILTKQKFSLKNSPAVKMYTHLAFIFSNLGLYEKSIELYKEAISANKISINSPVSIVLHIIIGYLYYHSSKFDDAFTPYGIALSLLDETNLLSSELYSHIGDVWNKMENEDIALSCYKEALKIANDQDFPSLPNIYRNIIDILGKKGNCEEVSLYRKQAEEIDESQYHTFDSALYNQRLLKEFKNELDNDINATSKTRIEFFYQNGLYWMIKGDFDQALTSLLEAEELIMKEPPSWYRFPHLLSTLFDNIALLYLFREDYLKALAMWKKGIHIRNSFHCY